MMTNAKFNLNASLEHFANISRGPLREIDNAGWLAGEELALTLPA